MNAIALKWGNSLGLRLPAFVAKKLGITAGSILNFNLMDDTIVISKHKETLGSLLDQIDETMLHKEQLTDDEPRGHEVW